MRTRVLVSVVAAATLAAAGCADRSVGSATTTSAQSTAASLPAVGAEITVGGMKATYHGVADVSGTSKATIRMADNYFEPTVLHGKAGQELALTLENEGRSQHTFTPADGKADVEVKPGSMAEAKITLPQSGNLAFYCRFHEDKRMAGVFNVSGPLDSPGPNVSRQTR